MKSNSIIRQVIKTYIRAIREARRNRSVPMLLGCGWTIQANGIGLLSLVEKGGYNFSARWNHGSVYYAKDAAKRIEAALRGSRPELSLTLIHHDDARDQDEKKAVEMLAKVFPFRNQAQV